jgi:hypothetical protein
MVRRGAQTAWGTPGKGESVPDLGGISTEPTDAVNDVHCSSSTEKKERRQSGSREPREGVGAQ